MMQRQNKNYILHRLVVGEIDTNCYIFGSRKTKEVAVIDPGADYETIKALLDKEGLIPKFIINTHGHMDHIGANKSLNLPIYIHKQDVDFLTDPKKNYSAYNVNPVISPKADRELQDGDIIEISDIQLRVIHTPGHTPGGISLHYNGIVFTGDTLFRDGIGRTDFPYSDYNALIDSIKTKLMVLGDDVLVYPGHGSPTTIKYERAG